MAKVKYWVLEGVDKIIEGTYNMAKYNNDKSNFIQATDGTKYNISGQNHGYNTFAEAEAAFNSSTSTSTASKTTKKEHVSDTNTEIIDLPAGSYIGSDEVGKVEPLKQLTSVAVYVSTDKFDKIRSLGVDDSKKIPSKINTIGKTLTGFDSYDQIKSGEIYENEEYGLIFCPLILSNEKYNEYHDKGINANAVLTKVHNDANLILFNHLKNKGITVSHIMIDDYMNSEGKTKFENYLGNFNDDKITEQPGLDMHFQVKADGIYKEIVGTSSDICAYIDGLWQSHLNEKYGMTLDYGNRISDCNLKNSFDCISRQDPDMKDVKHTKTYENWKKL